MNEKQKGDIAIEEDQINLENLEKEFQVMITGLISEHSFEGFRGQYEEIYNAFLESQKNNKLLIVKCRELNHEILANATKINSVLRLSEDDQRTIQGLKYEFEKAWKMVELSQDREQKSKDVIDTLKSETNRLNKIVEQGGALAFQNDQSLDMIQAEIKSMKQEIEFQVNQIQQLEQDLDKVTKEKAQFESETFKLKDESVTLEKDIEDAKEETKILEKAIEDTMMDMLGTKETIIDNRKEKEDGKEAKKGKNNSLSNYGKELAAVYREKTLEKESLEKQKAAVSIAKSLLDKKFTSSDKIEETIETVTEKINKIEAELKLYNEDSKKINSEIEINKAEYENESTKRIKTSKELSEIHQTLNTLRKDLHILQHKLIAGDSDIRGERQNIAFNEQRIVVGKGEIIKEKRKVEDIDNKVSIIYNEMLTHKIDIAKFDKLIQSIKAEIEQLIDETSQALANAEQLNVLAEQNKGYADENHLIINAINEKIQHQIAASDLLTEKRNVMKRKLEELRQEHETIVEDNSIVDKDIRDTKMLIKEKDTLCLETHINRADLIESAADAAKKKENLEDMLKKANVEIITLENTKMRTRYLLEVAEKDIRKTNTTIKGYQTEQKLLQNRIHEKHYEIELLREKLSLITGRLNATAATYDQKCDSVEDLKEELKFEVQKKKQLMDKCKHEKYLKTEMRNIEKDLIFQQGKCKALEEELETPMNIHRWRFLQFSNPEMMKLIKMGQSLRNSLMLKLSRIDRLKQVKIQKEKDAKNLKRKLGKPHDIEKEIREARQILEAQTEQLDKIEDKICSRESTVEEKKRNTEELREELSHTKKKFFASKKKVETIRSSSACKKPKYEKSDKKFIGGGFSVGQVNQASQSISALDSKLMGAIVIPKVTNSKPQKLNPRGWNPTRSPLRPFLPTVSELSHS